MGTSSSSAASNDHWIAHPKHYRFYYTSDVDGTEETGLLKLLLVDEKTKEPRLTTVRDLKEHIREMERLPEGTDLKIRVVGSERVPKDDLPFAQLGNGVKIAVYTYERNLKTPDLDPRGAPPAPTVD